MGLFREVGRRVERFRKTAEKAAEAEADYRCEACGESVFTDGDPGRCPDCGAAALVATDDADEAESENGTDANAQN